MKDGGDRNGVFQAKGGEILLNRAVIGMSQAWGQREPMTQGEIDAMTTDVVYLDTRTDEGITRFLDMVPGGDTIMWLQEEEGEADRERAESPTGGKSSGAIAELADAIGVELPESVAGDDVDEEMEDDFPSVQGIPEAAWEGLRGLKGSKHDPIQAPKSAGETPKARTEKRGEQGGDELDEGIAEGDLRRLGLSNSRRAGDVWKTF